MEYIVNRFNTKRLLSQALCGLLLTTAASAASAASSSTGLSSLDILQQFNLVVLGDSTAKKGAEVDGRAYIGGTLNGGKYAVTTAQNTSTTAMKSSLSSLSKTLSTQATTGGYNVDQHNKATFTAKANTAGIAVINLTASDITKLNSTNNFKFNLDNSVKALLLNVSGQSSTLTANLFGSLEKLANKTLWNFYDATTVTLDRQFAGSVLAPNATLTNNKQILGGVYVNSLTQNGLIKSTTFTGATALTSITAAVPEPETYALMGLGLVMLGWRHKKSRATSLATA